MDTLIISLILLFILAPTIGYIMFLFSNINWIGKLQEDIERRARTMAGFSAAILCLTLNTKSYLAIPDLIIGILGTIGVWILILNDYCSLKWWKNCVRIALSIDLAYIALGIGIANIGVKLTNYNQNKNVPWATLFIIIIGFAFCCYGMIRNMKEKVINLMTGKE